MELVHEVDRSLPAAVYQYVVTANGGTVTLQISKDQGVTWQNMTNGTWAADEDGILYLSDCFVQVLTTGAAKFYLDRVIRGAKPSE